MEARKLLEFIVGHLEGELLSLVTNDFLSMNPLPNCPALSSLYPRWPANTSKDYPLSPRPDNLTPTRFHIYQQLEGF